MLCSMLIIAAASCTKEKCYIDITAPQSGAVFNAGDSVLVQADLWNDDALFSEKLIVTTGIGFTDTVLVFKDDKAVYNGKYHLSKKFICQPAAQYKIVIAASGAGKSAVDSLFISSN